MFEKFFNLWVPKTMQFRPGKFAFSVTELGVRGPPLNLYNFGVLASAAAAAPAADGPTWPPSPMPQIRSCKNLEGTPNP